VTQPAVAACDWGTTRLRIWLLDASGVVVAERRSDEGMLAARPDRFGAILERQLADMAAPADLPVIICGMAGARQGWIEAPYANVPVSLDEALAGSVRVPGPTRDVRIVPGLAQRAAEAPDVMRGEETQLAGAATLLGSGIHLVCMPGTHSKWVAVENGTVRSFQTFMTGELFSVLSQHSILSHAVAGQTGAVSPDNPEFIKACASALEDEAALTGLFRIRAATLLHDLAPSEAAARLSGLLIGSEIAGGLAVADNRVSSVVLVASGAMQALYQAALAAAGIQVRIVDADEAVRAGLWQAALHSGLAGGSR